MDEINKLTSSINDVEKEEKMKLTKQDLMNKFAEISGSNIESDQVLLS